MRLCLAASLLVAWLEACWSLGWEPAGDDGSCDDDGDEDCDAHTADNEMMTMLTMTMTVTMMLMMLPMTRTM